ncbi:MAG: LysR family transcriptional regulator [Rhizobiaceae bacterium]|nr:LysR family transcriptional regulator [Rhizobiaceae bacterium]
MDKLDYLSMNGRHLKVFLAIFETNSVGAAADELGINQSTVSYSLDKLRTYLGDPLFLKSGRGITPTEHAILLAPRIRALLTSMEDLASQDDYYPEQDDRPITMAANTLHLLPQWAKIYRRIVREAPNMPVRMLELGSRENIGGLLNSANVDLVFGVRPDSYADTLDAREVFSQPQACFYDPEHRGPVNTLADYFAARHAVLDFGSGNKSITDTMLDRSERTRNITLYAPNIEALATLIKGTDQIASFQQNLIKTVFNRFDCCEPPLALPQIDIDMIWHRRDENSGRSQWIRNLVISCVQESKND